ncbi:phage baseplate assembly protein W [Allocatelliglobosispora scoriae]|uniref:Phage baseplate assembly protein W n=1 Tax=Allocatelliglobosispora scoriae TaxID=643052 RepID=A0A841BLR1_9ACTN|nr:GPW/gp25 family protein [Allocatelliglobosispora scoriae]MBB5867913.1 phage baseplate assembly protein W [Allocatelliglobosispora scoriae]
MSEDFIGRGWHYPLAADQAGQVLLAGGDRKLEQSIRLILGTAYGERPMRPEFGCGIHDQVFDSVDATTAGGLAAAVRSSLTRWEPRIDVHDVTVLNDPDDPGTVLIDISYTAHGRSDPRNLVFPFYTIPGEGS